MNDKYDDFVNKFVEYQRTTKDKVPTIMTFMARYILALEDRI